MQRSGGQGTIPKGWRLVCLGDVANVQGGVGFPLHRQGRQSGDYPFIKVSDMNLDGNESYIRNANNYVDQRDAAELGASIFSPGTIVFPKVGAAIATNKKRALTIPTIIDNNMVGITVSNEQRCNARFLHNWFESIDIAQFANVSTVPSITTTRLKREFILLPPLPEQRAIAAVLDAIDDAIEGTEAVIAATEQLRDSLLHELLTRGVPGWHSEWKDVPGLGTIPADWEVVSMGEVYEVQLGKMLSPKAKQGANPKPYLTNRNVRWGGFDLADLPTMDFDEREIKKFQLRQGDLMVCEGGDTGRAAVWEEPIVDCYYQKALHRLRPKGNTEIPKFMLAVLMFYGNNGILLEYSEQTSISHLTRERLLRMPVPNPPRTEQQGIADTLDCIEFVLIQSQEEQDRLESLKHSVADGLLTGNLRISLPSVSTQCGLSDV